MPHIYFIYLSIYLFIYLLRLCSEALGSHDEGKDIFEIKFATEEWTDILLAVADAETVHVS
jgi:hypothetical protein